MNKLGVSAVFLIIGASVCLAQSSDGPLECYTCTSDKNSTMYHDKCHDDGLDTDGMMTVQCKQEENACYKWITVYTRIENGEQVVANTITTRMCGQERKKQNEDEVDLEDCDIKESASGLTTNCRCGSKLCNAGEYIKASLLSVAIASVLSVISALML